MGLDAAQLYLAARRCDRELLWEWEAGHCLKRTLMPRGPTLNIYRLNTLRCFYTSLNNSLTLIPKRSNSYELCVAERWRQREQSEQEEETGYSLLVGENLYTLYINNVLK